jgi:hypothetical protein
MALKRPCRETSLTNLGMRRYILFAIDVEPDGRAEVRNDPWSGTAVTLRELMALRSDLEEMCRAPVR